ncbi:MAG: TolC family protein [Bacteroidales bacterium]|nr:TolC family protein [Bacteroidales bacterium]
MKKLTITSLLFICVVSLLSAKEAAKQWSLNDCLEYAVNNNIKLQQSRIMYEQSAIDVKSARADMFPSLSFSTNHNVVNRPFEENSNTVSGSEIITSNKKSTYNGNYGLNANWTIWNGNKRRNLIKQSKSSKEIASLNVTESENALKEEITQLYIQILYATESVNINQNTLEVSKATYERGEELYRAGSISKVELAQLETQVSNDEYQLVMSKNALRNYKLDLKQLLEMPGTTPMELVIPELDEEDILAPLPSQNDIYLAALDNRPEIKSGKLSIESSKLDVSIAKSGYYPSISLNASTSSNTNSASAEAWGEQMKVGWNNVIGLNLSLPIYDKRQSKSAKQKAELQYTSTQLEMANIEKELYQTIETMWLDADNAQQQYVVASSKLNSSKTSFDMTNEQFSLGMKNIVELLTEKNNYLSAQQEVIQAKYMAILERVLLNFYAGNPIEL